MFNENTAPAFCVLPYRILNLPNLTIQLLKFYEKIFQFWNKGNQCFAGNELLREYAGMKSVSSVSDAFKYFEEHGEIKRIYKNGCRYIVAPSQFIEIDSEVVDKSESVDKPLATARPPLSLQRDPPLATARHNNNKLNKSFKSINKSFSTSSDQKQNTSRASPTSTYVNRSTVSEEAKNAKRGNVSVEEKHMQEIKRKLSGKLINNGCSKNNHSGNSTDSKTHAKQSTETSTETGDNYVSHQA